MTFPPALRWLWKGWQRVAHAIGRRVSWVILSFVWLVVLGAYALAWRFTRLFRRQGQGSTAWVDIPARPPEDMRYQF